MRIPPIGILASLLLPACGDAPSAVSSPATVPAPPPAPSTEGTVRSADGVPIRYVARGSGETTLVFVHCWSCDLGYWSATMDALADRYGVVAMDLAGHGDSGSGRNRWDVRGFAGDVRAVIETLDLRRVVLVGHSMGGPVGVEAAPLLGERVIGVVGIDTIQDVDPPFTPAELEAFLAAMQADFPAVVSGFVRGMFPPEADPAVVERVAADMAAAPPEVAVPAMRELFSYDLKGGLAALDVPLVCINSTRFPTQVERNREYAPRFDVVLMGGVGHFPMLEKPGEFDEALAAVVERLERERDGLPRGPPAGPDDDTACATDDDCVMSDFPGCCDCCQCATEPYAVNRGTLAERRGMCSRVRCGCSGVECPPCEPAPSPGSRDLGEARCDEGRCAPR